MSRIGCLVVGFIRPVELSLVLEKVVAQDFDKIFISIDSASKLDYEFQIKNDKSVSVAKTYASKFPNQIELIQNELPAGIIANFTNSIDLAFKSVDYLCVLEDDCIPSNDTVNYIKQLIEVDLPQRVKMYSLTRPPISRLSKGYFFTHNPLMWGWVISRSNWQEIKIQVENVKRSKHLLLDFRLLFQGFTYSGFIRASKGSFDALDALFAYTFLVKDYLVIGPPINLISNIGVGPDATNTKIASKFMNTPLSKFQVSRRLDFLNLKKTSVLRNDFLIYRQMGSWKYHHLFTSILYIVLKR